MPSPVGTGTAFHGSSPSTTQDPGSHDLWYTGDPGEFRLLTTAPFSHEASKMENGCPVLGHCSLNRLPESHRPPQDQASSNRNRVKTCSLLYLGWSFRSHPGTKGHPVSFSSPQSIYHGYQHQRKGHLDHPFSRTAKHNQLEPNLAPAAIPQN